MLDIQFIRQNEAQVRAAITNKRLDLNLDELLGADKERRESTTLLEQKRARRNELSTLIPKASKDDRPKLVDEAKQILMDRDAMDEADAFGYIQRTAMQTRARMRDVAQQIVDGTLTP